MRSKDEIMQGRGKDLTEEEQIMLHYRNLEIVDLRLKGLSYSEIGKRYNLSRETIKLICHKHGVSGNITQ